MLLFLCVELAADAARPTAQAPKIFKGQPDRMAELLFLPDRGFGEAQQQPQPLPKLTTAAAARELSSPTSGR